MGLFSARPNMAGTRTKSFLRPEPPLPEEDTSPFAGFKTKDWLGLGLSAIGDAFARTNGGEGWAVPMQFEGIQRAKAARDAAAQRQQVVQTLVARGVPLQEATVLAGDKDATSKILGGQYEYHAPKDPYRFEDNAGNVWERGDTGENKRIFTDLAPKQFLQDGQLVTVPNPYASGADMGTDLPPGWKIEGTASQPDPAQAARVKQQLLQHFGPGPRAESEYQKWLQTYGGGR